MPSWAPHRPPAAPQPISPHLAELWWEKKLEASTEIAIGEKKLARQRPKHASLRRRCLADMVKSAIKVVVRVRPTPDFAQGAIDLHQDKKVRVPKHNARCKTAARSLHPAPPPSCI